ncbi:Leucine-rich repeat-containing protein 70 [Amphibalanus amphitrite]|uniref:Leucine-rich repeat-containing protein 70 n=1 Tax=Amphibalanus amphitrite TaxID=1232801 RepID=A0A6A4W3P3_AMPAM|nr:Leucine-rich repeat-containing protein 70 [Amphibalanus amphitrite]
MVLCIDAGLTAPPRRLPATVQHLSLAGNRIRRLRRAAFIKLPQLRTLDLDNNRIRRVAPFAFLGLLSLERLSLQGNPLGELAGFSLGGLRNITYLYVGHSGVRRVRPLAFSTSADVRLISLGGNPAAALEPRAFAGLQRVHHLLLPERLQRVAAGAFSGLRDVDVLVVRQPQLENLPAGLLSGLQRAARLTVIGGEVGVMDRHWMEGVGPVQVISFTNVTIGELGGLNITGPVGRLEMRGNRVHAVALSDVLTLSPCAEERLVLVDNLLPCTCDLHRLMTALRGAGYNVTRFSEQNRCLTPPVLQQRHISGVSLPSAEECAVRDREELERRKSEEAFLRAMASAGRCFGVTIYSSLFTLLLPFVINIVVT